VHLIGGYCRTNAAAHLNGFTSVYNTTGIFHILGPILLLQGKTIFGESAVTLTKILTLVTEMA
jgi:hypothetical protein